MNLENPQNVFENKTILITGGTGTIGKALCKKLIALNPRQIRIYSRDDTKHFELSQELKKYGFMRYLIGDVRDRARLRRAVEGVDFIFHVAALKHVGICEYNPFEAIKTNAVGTQNLIDVAIDHNVEKFLLISTDKATNPTNTMGVTKLLAERLTISANIHKGGKRTVFSAVRFGNVFASRGSVIPLFFKQLQTDGIITVTNPEMTRYVMSLDEASEFVISSMVKAKGGEIFIKKMPAIKIKDLADAFIEVYRENFEVNNDKIKIDIIGKKAGERIHEILFTAYESLNCYELEDRYVVLPEIPMINKDYSDYLNKPKTQNEDYTSEKVEMVKKEDIRNMILDYFKNRERI
jgi:FlaA1/EpsC-like NDP-sugar epimerase